jgi:hypothetical protein
MSHQTNAPRLHRLQAVCPKGHSAYDRRCCSDLPGKIRQVIAHCCCALFPDLFKCCKLVLLGMKTAPFRVMGGPSSLVLHIDGSQGASVARIRWILDFLILFSFHPCTSSSPAPLPVRPAGPVNPPKESIVRWGYYMYLFHVSKSAALYYCYRTAHRLHVIKTRRKIRRHLIYSLSPGIRAPLSVCVLEGC